MTVSTNAGDTVAKLKAAPGKDIWLFGGGSLFRNLLGMGLVDTVEVGIIPVLLGGGIRLLPDPAERAKLKLTKHRVYTKTGTVGLEYDVA
jgi:dihydrofolate reductase